MQLGHSKGSLREPGAGCERGSGGRLGWAGPDATGGWEGNGQGPWQGRE